jgi:isopentenyl-diphosphate delta-isomerase
MEHVILVDQNDNAIGTMEKMEAHRKGLLHRAFSVVIFNSKGEILLQKRANSKYHSGGLWTNACCSHPLPEEPMEVATRRKLNQEMGIDLKTDYAYKFIYRTELDSGLIEHECDYVFTGIFDGKPIINEHEVEDWKFVSTELLHNDIKLNPQNYTYWFKLILSDNRLAGKNSIDRY